jgi:serine/threonine protein kinase
VVYEWLYGVPPFQGQTPVEIALQHIQDSPPSLREKAPMLPLELEQVIEKALAKLPKERFATIKAFCTALVDASQKPLDGPIQLP